MRVAINDSITTRGISGSSRGVRLIEEGLAPFSDIEVLRPDRSARSRVGRLLGMIDWDLRGSVNAAVSKNADVLIHTANTGVGSRQLPTVLLMHDTMVLDHPKLFDPGYVKYARALFPLSVRAADTVVTVSLHSARRIRERWRINNVEVIPWPALNVSTRVPLSDRDRYRVLMVSSADKHKRLNLGVEVLTDLRQEFPELTLTVVTRPGNGTDQFMRAVEKANARDEWVLVKQSVSEIELTDLYQSVSLLLIPSIDEGFCLPALEAASHGTPVVHCERGALPDVYPWVADGEGPQGHFDADRALLQGRTRSVLADQQVAEGLVRGGLERTDAFSMKRFSEKWIDLIKKLSERS